MKVLPYPIPHTLSLFPHDVKSQVIAQAESESKNKAIAHTVTQPPHVDVNEILIRPTQQER
ncbi:hypothetical protein [Nostoc sp. PA-18-2419]|uniref:hypothetical protein n=1 Tax=Nostoc sp. PA-18-2419 TaxID=2575443 RepID=UPI001679C711|nr:hypothetical protein [Nostoc sp. PA-18-2419]